MTTTYKPGDQISSDGINWFTVAWPHDGDPIDQLRIYKDNRENSWLVDPAEAEEPWRHIVGSGEPKPFEGFDIVDAPKPITIPTDDQLERKLQQIEIVTSSIFDAAATILQAIRKARAV